MLGWHVHEKAILMTILPLSLLACDRVSDTSLFLWISIIGYYSLFPLLFRPEETLIKILLYLIYFILVYVILKSYHNEQQHKRRIAFHSFFQYDLEVLYLIGLAPLYVFTSLICPLFLARFQFLPLFCTSVYCSIGMCYAWWLCYRANYYRIAILESYE